MYVKDIITYEELMEYLNKLDDKPEIKEPPIIY